MTVFQTACFTDIQGYSTREDQEGHRANQEVRDEYQRVAQALVELNQGSKPKDTGDGLMATFEDPEDALRFAVEHQQYFQDRPCIAREPLRVRVVLASGVLELK